MEVIGKTNTGVIISASNYEVNEILRAVTGTIPKELEVGQKLPAIDYASTITKIKNLSKHSDYTCLLTRMREFYESFNKFQEAVEKASTIEI